MLEIEIDGKNIAVEEGSMIIDAASRVGSYIPHFCYHKKLSIAANCRMCLVEVENSKKPVPACATPVSNGMKVYTDSKATKQSQQAVMRFLLINHPLDCPICDQGGECQLQDLAVGYGCNQSRYTEEKRVVFNKNLGPLVATEMTRCINCTRCVRFLREIAGKMELGQAYRGEKAEIMPFIEQSLESELSGNIIDLCPVGALTSKPFRFSARSWEMSRRKTISPHDAFGSNQLAQVKYNKVLRMLPYENEEVNECWLSDRDRFAYEGLQSTDRLQSPMIKQDGVWHKVDWNVALDYVQRTLSSIISDHGAQSIGALSSPISTVEEMYLLQKLVRGLGSENIDFRLRVKNFEIDKYFRGLPWLGMHYEEISQLDHVFVIGTMLRKKIPLLAHRLRQASKHQLKISSLSTVAEDWQVPLAHQIVVKPSQIKDKLAQVLAALCSIKKLDLLSGLSELKIEQDAFLLAQQLLESKNTAVWLMGCLLTSEDILDVHHLAQQIAKISDAKLGVIPIQGNTIGGFVANALPSKNGLNVREMLQQARKAYLLLNCEIEDFTHPKLALDALKQAASVMVLSPYASPELLELADVILPIAPYTETSGTFINMEARVQSFQAVNTPLGDCRPAWKVLRVMGNVLKLAGFDYQSSQEVLDDVGVDDLTSALTNQLKDYPISFDKKEPIQGLELIPYFPMYSSDIIVRRATSLQKTPEAQLQFAQLNPETMRHLNLSEGDALTISHQNDKVSGLFAKESSSIPIGCIMLSEANKLTWNLGEILGTVTVERA